MACGACPFAVAAAPAAACSTFSNLSDRPCRARSLLVCLLDLSSSSKCCGCHAKLLHAVRPRFTRALVRRPSHLQSLAPTDPCYGCGPGRTSGGNPSCGSDYQPCRDVGGCDQKCETNNPSNYKVCLIPFER